MKIESAQNTTFKRWLKLSKRKYRELERKFIVEGHHLVVEAMKQDVIETIIVKESFTHELNFDGITDIVYLKDSLFDQLAKTPSPQPVMAVCSMLDEQIEAKRRILICDEIQDPGNLGTLIRSAVAFNFDGIVLGEGCVDVYNEKVVRSTQGAIFKIPITKGHVLDVIETFKSLGIKVYGTSVVRALPLDDVEAVSQMAFILGNEGQGVNPKHLEKTDQNIYIEMSEKTESLNVSIAGSIIMHRFRL